MSVLPCERCGDKARRRRCQICGRMICRNCQANIGMGMKGAYVWCETRRFGLKYITDCKEQPCPTKSPSPKNPCPPPGRR